MKFFSAFGQSTNLEKAIEQAVYPLNEAYDIGFLFCSGLYPDVHLASQYLKKHLHVNTVIGCTCTGLVTKKQEIAGDVAGVSLLLGQAAKGNFQSHHIIPEELKSLSNKEAIYDMLDIFPHEHPSFILLADPYTFDAGSFISLLANAYPGEEIIGGLASGRTESRSDYVFHNDQAYDKGATLLTIRNVKMQTRVTHGCLPLGDPFFITDAKQNVIKKLAGKDPWPLLNELVEETTPELRLLSKHGVFAGLADNEKQAESSNYLIRSVMAADPETGRIAVGGPVQTGQLVQFHVRSGRKSAEDLVSLCKGLPDSKAILSFNCNGRAEHGSPTNNDDAKLIHKTLPGVALSGFQCAGEIGPLLDQPALHTFTNCMAFFSED